MKAAMTAAAPLPGALGRSRETVALTLFLIATGVSFVVSVSLWFSGHETQGIFVGLWVPSILSLAGLILNRRERR